MALVELDDIWKSFSTRRGRSRSTTPAVKGVSLAVDRSETVALVGESGSGKSTLGRIALRLLDADRGRVSFAGESMLDVNRRELRLLRRDVQMVFQDPFASLDPRMLIDDLVAEPIRVHRLAATRDELRSRTVELLDRVGLGPQHLGRFPYEFSGGQLQRIAIARALATRPKFVVCDEPVAALDVSIRAQVINLLRDLQREDGIAYLFISHDLSLVQLIAHRVAVMYSGAIVETGSTEAVFTRPAHPYTVALLRAIPARDPARRHLVADHRGGAIPIERASSGCAYAPRCPMAHERCWTEPPAVVVTVDGSQVACHLAPSAS